MCATFGPSMFFQAPHRHQIAGAEIPDLTGVEPGFSEGGGRGGGGKCLDKHQHYLIVIVV